MPGKQIAALLGVHRNSVTRALDGAMTALAKDWIADPERCLMTILMFCDHLDQFVNPHAGPIPVEHWKYIKMARLVEADKTGAFRLLAQHVIWERNSTPTSKVG